MTRARGGTTALTTSDNSRDHRGPLDLVASELKFRYIERERERGTCITSIIHNLKLNYFFSFTNKRIVFI